MKTILAALCVLLLCIASDVWSGTLVKVEPLTEKEIADVRIARQGVIEARAKLAETELRIAKAHGMEKEEWMESKSWFEIDGDFILYRHQSLMQLLEGE